jgi:hypothetical protein
MDLSRVSQYYELKPFDVQPQQLLLDPTNPRIILDVETDRQFTQSEIQRPEIQEYILRVINKKSHHIAELIRSIETSGFIDKGDDMIVRRVGRSSLFLVIEGNRRTTAIKHLAAKPERLHPAVRQTLHTLHVKEFIYKPNSYFSEEMIIDTILGTIHVTGRLQWGALEKAYYIYRSYRRELGKLSPGQQFVYLPGCAKEIATFFNLSVKAVRKEIIVYRAYEHLKEQGYDVAPHHFTLIDLAVTDRKLSEAYFELSPVTFRFSNRGLARFDKLCIRNRRAINNPKDFRIFSLIYRNGTDLELSQAESGEKPLDKLWDGISTRMDQKGFISDLQRIKKQLESIHPGEFRGLKSELDLIAEIRALVLDDLCPLMKSPRKRD